MANSKIFCSIPWISIHLYWDGGFGICCSESSRIYGPGEWKKYNIQNYTVSEWFNLPIVKNIRQQMIEDNLLKICNNCYLDESVGRVSKRIRENFKTVVFTKDAFDRSYQQSHWNERFQSHNADQNPPIDWHIDLGNECNLACKMCGPSASSIIQEKYKKWNISVDSRKNWTNSDIAWKNLLKSIDETPIHRLHLMGGEPLLNKRFHNMIDHLIETNRSEISISFVSNGILFTEELLDKLRKFKNVDIEISLESITETNSYIRQGKNSDKVFDIVKNILKHQDDKIRIILRSTLQLLNVNNYDQYILWAWKNKVCITSLYLKNPDYLAINVLPVDLRKNLISKYTRILKIIEEEKQTSFNTIISGRNPYHLDIELINETNSVINLLNSPEPENIEELRTKLASWLMKWDNEFKLDAYKFYPEYNDFLRSIGYEI